MPRAPGVLGDRNRARNRSRSAVAIISGSLPKNLQLTNVFYRPERVLFHVHAEL